MSEINSNQKRSNRKKNKKKLTKKQKIAIGIGSFFVVLLLLLGGTYFYFKGLFYKPTENIDFGDKGNVEYKQVDGITNVLLIGSDARTLDEKSRSDSMIIATIDSKNKNIKLTSIMRDTLVEIPGHGEQKINAAYAYGGVELLMETIQRNFGIKLNEYVAVNFWGFESIIDELGGIEVEVKDYEINEINKYAGESTGGNAKKITEPGVQVLDGKQALSYARIRKVGNGAYERDERQRFVLTKVAEKVKDTSVLRWPALAKSLSGHVKTNIDLGKALNYAYTISKMPSLDFMQLQIPQNELSWGGLYKNKGWVLLIDKEQNQKVLQEFIFENKIPDPKTYDVKAWNSKLSALKKDEQKYNNENNIKPEDHVTDEDKGKPQEELPKEETKIPNANDYISVGMNIDTAITKLKNAGLDYKIMNKGTEIASFKQKGKLVEITLKEIEQEKPVVEEINIDSLNLIGKTFAEAKSILKSKGFVVVGTGTDKDKVVSYSPGGKQKVGTTITLVTESVEKPGNDEGEGTGNN